MMLHHRSTLNFLLAAAMGVAGIPAALVATSHTALARPDGAPGSRHVEFVQSAPRPVGGDFGCDPTDATRCGGTFRNVRTLTGDLAGTTYQVGSAVLLPDQTYLGHAVTQFTGTVDGCGSGTFVIQEVGILDPATGDNWGTGEITAGHGTGDLAQLSGSLIADSRTGDTVTGTIRCT